ncbi:MFS transporter [Cupriavidus basilensis]
MEHRLDAALAETALPGSPAAPAAATLAPGSAARWSPPRSATRAELFDFTVFSFFAGLIGKLFFPVEGEYGSLAAGAGDVRHRLRHAARGQRGDRQLRRPCRPQAGLDAHDRADVARHGHHRSGAHLCADRHRAPLLVVTGRLLQGFSAGGEIGAATSFLMESGTRSNRGFMVSWQMAGQGASALAGALCGALLDPRPASGRAGSWGWRVPFLLGLLIGPVGFYIRRHLDETHQDVARERAAR